ncbi:MAG: pyridoxamine 5'-phosphate oxidase [Candidatus Nanopelagicales bacterium]
MAAMTARPEPHDALARLAAMREPYADGELLERDVAPEPLEQFARWLADAVAAELPEPNAMVLATSGADGQPSARTVLLKEADDAGFGFFTNLGSHKSRQLAENPRAALLFPWFAMLRQVHVEGPIVSMTREESARYFSSRPYGSRIGAWASEQSTVIPSRDELDQRYAELARRWPDTGSPADVPLPDHWGGFRVEPHTVEFWQGRVSRLHDRLRYRSREGPQERQWVVERLSP